jgi:hypothetical protein
MEKRGLDDGRSVMGSCKGEALSGAMVVSKTSLARAMLIFATKMDQRLMEVDGF